MLHTCGDTAAYLYHEYFFVIAIVLLALTLVPFMRKKEMLVTYSIMAAGLLSIFFFKYMESYRYHGLIFIAFIALRRHWKTSVR